MSKLHSCSIRSFLTFFILLAFQIALCSGFSMMKCLPPATCSLAHSSANSRKKDLLRLLRSSCSRPWKLILVHVLHGVQGGASQTNFGLNSLMSSKIALLVSGFLMSWPLHMSLGSITFPFAAKAWVILALPEKISIT